MPFRANRIVAFALAAGLIAATPLPPAPPPPDPGTASDTFFGVTVPDPYRVFEDKKNPALQNYFKTQNAYTRAVLSAISGRDALSARMAELDKGSESLSSLTVGDRAYFYLRRPVGASALRLYRRTPGANENEHLVFDPDRLAKAAGSHYAIDFYAPSRDGKLVAAGVSEGGSEEEVTHVLDVATGKMLADTIDRTPFTPPTWLPDGSGFYYFRTPKLAPNAPQSARDTDGVVYLHRLGTNPNRDRAVFGYRYDPKIPFAPEDAAIVILTPGSTWAICAVFHGVQNEIAAYVAPAASLSAAHVAWRPIVSYADGVTSIQARGDVAFALTHNGASRFEITAFDLASGDAKRAKIVVPQTDRVISSFAIASDAMYVDDLDRGISRVRRVPFTGKRDLAAPSDISLPFDGAIGEVDANVREPGAVLDLQGWTHSPLWYAVAPNGDVKDTGLRRPAPVDFSGMTAEEVSATSADGTQVPLSIVHQTGAPLDGSHPTLLDGYGAYGFVIAPAFNAMRLAWLERGGVFAECHPRGGGELGNDWHFAAHIATKQRTIDDFLGCAHYLIDHRYTTSEKLAGMGTSAGGVTIGNAIVQQPGLFAAAIDNVGDTNGVRDEFAEGGPANIPEFGTVKDPIGFKALYETDAYVQMKPGVAYPAVLAITGANDPRVAPWIVGKFIAKLQRSTTSGKPVLLRVDFDAGHGLLDASREQVRNFYTDEYSFLFWQLGDPEFSVRTT